MAETYPIPFNLFESRDSQIIAMQNELLEYRKQFEAAKSWLHNDADDGDAKILGTYAAGCVVNAHQALVDALEAAYVKLPMAKHNEELIAEMKAALALARGESADPKAVKP